ncbi:MAG TPA: PIG-L family deacetylase [Egibacteraceae bacterium]|nr:PIG-L family deacetylase [Egibacteraceae bacterium]
MSALRRLVHRAARRAAAGAPAGVREAALALAARAGDGPALLPGPPPGPVLIIAPHPDDETIGAGGALARHAERGDVVTVLVATSGERTRGGAGDVAAAREAECRAACADLGVAPPVFLRLRDGRLSDDAERLCAAILTHGSDAAVIYAPSPLDPHRDHRAANTALAAIDIGEAEIYGYEVWSAGPIDVVLDVGEAYARKEQALRRYSTALDSVDYVRAARGLAAYRSVAGGLRGQGLAEGFIRLSTEEHRRLVAMSQS